MQKANVNFVVDAIAFVIFVFLIATGVLIRYVLPPGSGHFSLLWGMDRHQWGQVHFWIAVALMTTLALHLFLHWNWVVGMIRGRASEASGSRLILALVAIIALVALAIAPFFAQVEHRGEPPHKLRSSAEGEGACDQIYGSMTLAQVEQQTGVPAAAILRELGLPLDLPADARLGQLRKQHGFEIEDVREVVRRLREDVAPAN